MYVGNLGWLLGLLQENILVEVYDCNNDNEDSPLKNVFLHSDDMLDEVYKYDLEDVEICSVDMFEVTNKKSEFYGETILSININTEE